MDAMWFWKAFIERKWIPLSQNKFLSSCSIWSWCLRSYIKMCPKSTTPRPFPNWSSWVISTAHWGRVDKFVSETYLQVSTPDIVWLRSWLRTIPSLRTSWTFSSSSARTFGWQSSGSRSTTSGPTTRAFTYYRITASSFCLDPVVTASTWRRVPSLLRSPVAWCVVPCPTLECLAWWQPRWQTCRLASSRFRSREAVSRHSKNQPILEKLMMIVLKQLLYSDT